MRRRFEQEGIAFSERMTPCERVSRSNWTDSIASELTQRIRRARSDVRPFQRQTSHIKSIGAVDVPIRVVERLTRSAEQPVHSQKPFEWVKRQPGRTSRHRLRTKLGWKRS